LLTRRAAGLVGELPGELAQRQSLLLQLPNQCQQRRAIAAVQRDRLRRLPSLGVILRGGTDPPDRVVASRYRNPTDLTRAFQRGANDCVDPLLCVRRRGGAGLRPNGSGKFVG